MAIRTNYLFRIAVNGTLGVALMLPFAVYLCGGAEWKDNDTLEYTFNNANWVWVAILTLWSAVAFQYLSIVGKHKLVVRACLFWLSAWGGFITVAVLTAILLALTGVAQTDVPATVSGLSLWLLELGGALLGCTLWLQANGLSWAKII